MKKYSYSSSHRQSPSSSNKKRLNVSINTSPSSLIKKYGYKNVQMLECHLKNVLDESLEAKNFHEVNSIKEKIQVLHSENDKHYEYKKSKLIKHLVKLMENQAITILNEFEEYSEKSIKDLQNELNDLKQEMKLIHEEEMNAELTKIYSKQQIYHPSSEILRLEDQIAKLLLCQDYLSANRVKIQLQKCKENHFKKNSIQKNRNYKKTIEQLRQKHRKQKSAMNMRLQCMLMEQVRAKQRQLGQVLSKMKIVIERTQKDLFFSEKYEKLIDNALQKNKNKQIIKEILQSKNSTNKNSINSTQDPTVQNTKRMVSQALKAHRNSQNQN